LTLPVNSETAKTLFTVEEYLAEERYAELTTLLVELAETHGSELVADRTPGVTTVNRYLNVTAYCQRLLTALPTAGRAVARKQLDPLAQRWYETWRTTRDPRQLRRILAAAFVSSYGDNALWELGNVAWEQGDTSLAAAYWGQLTSADSLFPGSEPRYPDPEFTPAEIDARLILCEIFAQRFAGAERLIAAYRTRYGDAEGTLAGRTGPLADMLAETLTAARGWTFPDLSSTVATFGGSSARQRPQPTEWDLGPARWSASWPIRSLPSFPPTPVNDRGALQSFPVVDQQRVFVSEGDVIRAWNAVTGEPAWPNDQLDPSIIYPPVPDERGSTPDRVCVGVPWHTLTLHRGKLLARMGSPVTGAAGNELRDLVTEVVCLDVQTGQGRLIWKLAGHDLPTAGPAWSFEGTPLVRDETAFAVLYRRKPEPEFAIVAIEIETGDVQWLRSIGSARPTLDDSVNRVSKLLLTHGDGRLYLSTDQGAILAISPDDGTLLWAVTYESQPFDFLHGVPPRLQTGLLPAMFDRGRLFIAPNDSRLMFCLDAASGRVIWQRRMPERLRHLIGVANSSDQGRLIASGNSLWAFDINDGGLMWRMIQNDPESRGYGHGLLAGDSIFWPTREWLYQVRISNGELTRKVLLATPDVPGSGGNLTATNGMLFVAEPDRLVAYGEYSRLKERLEIELSQRTDQASPWQHLMDLEAAQGNLTAAVAAGRNAWELRESCSPADRAAMELRFASILRQQIARLLKQKQFSVAEGHFQELARLDLPPEARGQGLWDWSRLDLLRGEPAAAVTHLHDLLDLPAKAHFEIDGLPHDQAVQRELERMLQEFGRTAFVEIDRRAQQELDRALTAGDLPAARHVLRRYPLLPAAEDIWSTVISETTSRQQWNAAWTLLHDWESSTTRPDVRRLIQDRKHAALLAAGYDRSAQRLAASVDNVAAWRFVARGWQQELSPDVTTLCPLGQPPADYLACVLTFGAEGLTAIERQSGTQRWQQSQSAAPTWSAYAETHLLLFAGDTLSARSLETGELLWERPGLSVSSGAASIAMMDQSVITFLPTRGVSAVSTVTGEVSWEFRPPHGRFQPIWLCREDAILLQTLDPPEIWHIDPSTGKLLSVSAETTHAWRFPPLLFDDDQFAVVTTNRRIERWGRDGTVRWNYSGTLSHAHADPYLLGDATGLAVLIDGGTLVGIEPQTGGKLWSTGFADRPVIHPTRQLAVVQGLALTAWHTTLRAVRLTDGDLAWDAKLPAGVETWDITPWQDSVVLTGVRQEPSPTALLLIFDAVTGQPQQRVQQPCSASQATWSLDDYGVVCAQPGQLTAWNALPEHRLASP